MSQLNDIANEILETEFSFLTGIARSCQINSIENWFKYNYGKLNNRIYTSYSGENPNMNYEEIAIFKNMYLANYYKEESRKVLRNMGSDTIQWLTLREGDSSITQHNKNEVAKTYISMSRDIESETEKLVSSYNYNLSSPRQVSVDTYQSGAY